MDTEALYIIRTAGLKERAVCMAESSLQTSSVKCNLNASSTSSRGFLQRGG